MNSFTFAHVSDLHLPFEPALSLWQHFSKRQLSVWSWRRRKVLHRPEILDALASDLRSPDIEHVVVTGDLTNFSLPDEFRQAARWLETLVPAARLSLVPGNHDALVPVVATQGIDHLAPWMRAEAGWPTVHRHQGVTLIGLNSALPTAPLLAQGALGSDQLARLEQLLREEGKAGRTRVVLLHHPVADGAVSWRKALRDRAGLQAVLRRVGAELILHGHARDARLDSIAGPGAPIPCVCVPSSSAVPNPQDEGARWHRLCLYEEAGRKRLEVDVRRWTPQTQTFASTARYVLCLP
ncbi:MAG: metallophosphoesterase [Gammaproteobacteria bacterium]|nr:metallophosphoesterase [Gammaproteobacteria bacterium]